MRSVVAIVVMTGVAAADPAPGPSAKELVDWVDAKLAPIVSLEVELETKLPGKATDQYTEVLVRTDVVEMVRAGDRMRFESTGFTAYECKKPGCKRPKPEPPRRLFTIITNGGEQVQFMAGMKTGHKSKASKGSNMLSLATKLRAATKASRADAEGAYVLDVTDSKGNTKVFVSTTTGLPIKMITVIGGESTTTVVKRVEVDKKLGDDRFVVPADIKVE